MLRRILENLRQRQGKRESLSIKTIQNYFHALSSFNEFHVFYDMMEKNLVPAFIKRYLKQYKKNGFGEKRQLISIEQMALLINTTVSIRDKAVLTVLAKTGIRRGELIDIDVEDIDWAHDRIWLKPKKKRSNLIVFFDHETAVLLKRWLRVRASFVNDGENALFIGDRGGRIGRNIVYQVVSGNAKRLGLHDLTSNRLEDHFSPHCGRHWFTTHLRRSGLSKDFGKELRGDSRNDAIDIYDHIDHDELRRAYLEAIPRLGIA
jgi:integrase/recombinase XerD